MIAEKCQDCANYTQRHQREKLAYRLTGNLSTWDYKTCKQACWKDLKVKTTDIVDKQEFIHQAKIKTRKELAVYFGIKYSQARWLEGRWL